jgi:hypothetical protein
METKDFYEVVKNVQYLHNIERVALNPLSYFIFIVFNTDVHTLLSWLRAIVPRYTFSSTTVSMSESEIQSLVALIGSSVKIMLPLLLTHTVPNRLTLLVDANVEDLRRNYKHEIVAGDADQRFIASVVVRSVIRAVDINANDVACLDTGDSYQHLQVTFRSMIIRTPCCIGRSQ